MIPKHFQLKGDHQHSYEIHDARDGRSFHIAKQGLSLDMLGKLSGIKRFADGGAAEPTAADKIAQAFGYPNAGPKPAKKMAEGGEAEASAESEPDPLASLSSSQPNMTMMDAPGSPPNIGGVSESTGEMPAAAAASEAPPSLPGEPAEAPAAKLNDANPIGSAPTPEAPVQGLDDAEKTLVNARNTEVAASKQIGKDWNQFSQDVGALKKPEEIAEKYKKADDAFRADLDKNGKIDPNHYWASKTTGQKIMGALGMLLGGLGSGPNMVMENINKAIEQDIDAQKANRDNKTNLWKMNREAMSDDLSANLQTRNQLLTVTEAKIKSAMASVGGAEAQAKFVPILNQIQQQKALNHLKMGLASGGMSDMDPATLIPALVKNPAQQEAVAKATDVAKAVVANRKVAMDAFDRGVKEMSVSGAVGRLGRDSAAIGALHQAMLPMFADVDGTVRQAAMDETFHNIDPRFARSAADAESRRASLQNWMNGKQSSASSIARANGIDLSKFRVTSVPPTEGGLKTMNGVPYRLQPDGKYHRVR